MSLELVDRFIKSPFEIAKDVLVKVDKFIFSMDFVVMNIEENDDDPLILGMPFTKTIHLMIDIDHGNMKAEV